jgi:hypothetical protein
VLGRRTLLIACGSLLLPGAGRAADPKPPAPDSELLEFLGSSDDVDPDLQEYLERRTESPARDPATAPKRGSGHT